MPKLFIKLRKKLFLPFKWTRTIRKQISEFKFPSDTDVYSKLKEIEAEFLDAEKRANKEEFMVASEKLKLINWFIGK